LGFLAAGAAARTRGRQPVDRPLGHQRVLNSAIEPRIWKNMRPTAVEVSMPWSSTTRYTPQREINEGLNVVEASNRGKSVIFYGKGGDIATNRRDEQELSVLCLRVLQAALVYVNTLMVQDVLTDDTWTDRLTAADRRGLNPLFWTHVARTARSGSTCKADSA
jgi:hypothetical protein